MRPYLEHLSRSPDASWSTLNRCLDDEIPFLWHHHPEFELTLTLNSFGQRFVGDHVANYGHGDLVLVGPNLPHTWASLRKLDHSQPHNALVFWFSPSWLQPLLASSVELQPVMTMLDRAAGGLAFPESTGLALQSQYHKVFDLPPPQRLLALLAILTQLAAEPGARMLSATVPVTADGSRMRIDRLLGHLHENYAQPVSLDHLAELAALSVSGLHRLFVRHTQTTILDYVAQLRIGEACSRLSSTDQPISHIASDVGYPSLANFNRQFRRLRDMSPRAYRSMFRKM